MNKESLKALERIRKKLEECYDTGTWEWAEIDYDLDIIERALMDGKNKYEIH